MGQRVIVFRHDRVGDLIVTSPIFQAIKESQPDSHVTLIASPYNAATLEGLPYIDRILCLDSRMPLLRQIRLAWHLRQEKPDTTIVLSPFNTGFLLAWLTGARRRGGLLRPYRIPQMLAAPILLTAKEVLRRRRSDHGDTKVLHHSAQILRLGAALGFKTKTPPPLSLPDNAQAAARIQSVLDRFGVPSNALRIFIHLARNWQECGLEPGRVRGLLEAVRARLPSAWLLLSVGPEDGVIGEAVGPFVRAADSDPLASPPGIAQAILFRDLSFAEWAAIAGVAQLAITVDTGAVHVAAARKVPVVVVYRAERLAWALAEFGPWGVPFRAVAGGGAADALIGRISDAVCDLAEERVLSAGG